MAFADRIARDLGTTATRAARLDSDVAPFGAFPSPPAHDDWEEMARLTGSVPRVAIVGEVGPLPPGWTATVERRHCPDGPRGADADHRHPDEAEGADEVVPLGPTDVDEMLELVDLARPGPFLRRTVEFGGYLGIRRDGRLIAMAGERMRPPGFAEVSAVATHPDHRTRGLGSRLIRSVAAAVAVERGDRPFLHVAHENETARRLYASMGFAASDIEFTVVEVSPAPRGCSARPD